MCIAQEKKPLNCKCDATFFGHKKQLKKISPKLPN